MKYKISYYKQLKPILPPLISTVILSFLFLELLVNSWDTNYREFILITYAFIVLGFYLFTTLFIHFNYLVKDKNKALELDYVKKKIIFYNGVEKMLEKSLDCVDKIEVYQTNRYKQRIINLSPWSAYFYYIVYFKNNENIIMSRLLIDDLEKQVKDTNVYHMNRFYPLIPNS